MDFMIISGFWRDSYFLVFKVRFLVIPIEADIIGKFRTNIIKTIYSVENISKLLFCI